MIGKGGLESGKQNCCKEKLSKSDMSLQRNAYGYRDDEYLKLRIFNLHNATYAFTG